MADKRTEEGVAPTTDKLSTYLKVLEREAQGESVARVMGY